MPVLFIGVGYLAPEPSTIAMHVKMALSGGTSSHARNATLAPVALKPVPYEATTLFGNGGKGPRADHYVPPRQTTAVKARPRPMVAAFTPTNIEITGQSYDELTRRHLVNRGQKAGRLNPPVTTAMRRPAPPPAPKVEKKPAVESKPAEVAKAPAETQKADAPKIQARMQDRASAGVFLASMARPSILTFPGVGPAEAAKAPQKIAAAPSSMKIERGLVFQGESEHGYQARQRRCLATALYFEARGEPERGQLAVAQVVANRVRSSSYPDTICGVVYQGQWKKGCQFSFACDGRSDVAREEATWKVANKLAKKFTEGGVWLDEIGDATHYHATYVKPRWKNNMNRIIKIGRHIFYRAPHVPVGEPAATAALDTPLRRLTPARSG